MLKLYLFYFIFLSFFTVKLGAQTPENTTPTTTTPKKKKKKKATTTTDNNTIGKKKKSRTGINDGRDWRVVYVVQVMSNTDRTVVFVNKAKLYQMYPTQRIYVKNELPFYRLRMGFFASKEKAEKFRKQIGNTFGEPALVVKDKVVLNTIVIKKRRKPLVQPTTPAASTPSTTATSTKPKKDARKKN